MIAPSYHNFILLLITSITIVICISFIPPFKQQAVSSIAPICISLNEQNSNYLCASCGQFINSKNRLENQNPTSFETPLRIKNQDGFRIVAIKNDIGLKCAQLIHMINYEAKNFAVQNMGLQTMTPIKKLRDIMGMDIIPYNQHSKNPIRLLFGSNKNSSTQTIITSNIAKNFVVLELSNAPTAKTEMRKLYITSITPRFTSIVCFASGTALLIIFFYEWLLNKKFKGALFINMFVVLLVFYGGYNQGDFSNIHKENLHFASILFICLCLFKVFSTTSNIVIVTTIGLFGQLLSLNELYLLCYALGIIILISNGINQLRFQQIFLYLLLMMCTLFVAELFGIYNYQFQNESKRKLIIIGVLSLSSIMMQITDDIVIKQFVEVNLEEQQTKNMSSITQQQEQKQSTSAL